MEDAETAETHGATMVVTIAVSGLLSCCSAVADVAETHLVVAASQSSKRRGHLRPLLFSILRMK